MAFLAMVPAAEFLMGALGVAETAGVAATETAAVLGTEAGLVGAEVGVAGVATTEAVAMGTEAVVAETEAGIVMTESAAATESGTMAIAEAEGGGLSAAEAEAGGGGPARSAMSNIAKNTAKLGSKAMMAGGAAAMWMSGNPGKTALLYSEGRRVLFGNADHRPNCKRDPLGAYACDIQKTFTSLDCTYSPLLVGGTIWAGTMLVLRDWRIPTILSGGYVAYAYSPIAQGDKQDQNSCKNEGLIGRWF